GDTNESVLCVDSFCKCAPNFNKVTLGANQSEPLNSLVWTCQQFECTADEDCQTYDHHRICQKGTGRCVCRPDFLEDSTNGRKCSPQYGIMPVYNKMPRKYLNKNRISYRKDIEH